MIYTSSDFGAPSFIRTIAEAAETDPHIIADIEEAYVAEGARYGFYIADESEVPGLRCVMVFMEPRGDKSVKFTGAVMRDDGLIRSFERLRNSGQMLRTLLNGDSRVQEIYRGAGTHVRASSRSGSFSALPAN